MGGGDRKSKASGEAASADSDASEEVTDVGGVSGTHLAEVPTMGAAGGSGDSASSKVNSTSSGSVKTKRYSQRGHLPLRPSNLRSGNLRSAEHFGQEIVTVGIAAPGVSERRNVFFKFELWLAQSQDLVRQPKPLRLSPTCQQTALPERGIAAAPALLMA